MMSFEGATCKEGLVAEAKPGWARVRFEDLDGLLTDWLPVVVLFSLGDRTVHTLKIGAQAACLMDAQLTRGWVVGCIFSDVDTPPTDLPEEHVTHYEDGTRISYNKSSHTHPDQGGQDGPFHWHDLLLHGDANGVACHTKVQSVTKAHQSVLFEQHADAQGKYGIHHSLCEQ